MPEFDRFGLMLDDVVSKGQVLFVRAVAGEAADAIGPERLVCEQSFRPEYDRLLSAGFVVETSADRKFSLVLLNATRSRTETLGNIARSWAMLDSGGVMLVNIDKTEGADSLLKHLRARLPVTEAVSKSHGRLIRLDRGTQPAPDWAAALAPLRNAESYFTVPGVFGADKGDGGSKLLAAHFGPGLKGRVADLGAGWGYLTVQALQSAPDLTEIHLFEAEARALDCARLNVVDARAQFHWADVLTPGSFEPFDAVICNPPFHANRAADPSLGVGFIAAAARLLKPSGRAWFVANRNLPYEAPLDTAFIKVTRVAQSNGFKVFLCERPKKGRH